MTLAARLEDLEVTLEHMLMDVFVSLPTVLLNFISNYGTYLISHKVYLIKS